MWCNSTDSGCATLWIGSSKYLTGLTGHLAGLGVTLGLGSSEVSGEVFRPTQYDSRIFDQSQIEFPPPSKLQPCTGLNFMARLDSARASHMHSMARALHGPARSSFNIPQLGRYLSGPARCRFSNRHLYTIYIARNLNQLMLWTYECLIRYPYLE